MKKKIKLPDSELEIMLLIWELGGKVSTSDIMERFKSGTVQLLQSYLKRLEEKEFIKVEKLGRLNFYTPLISLEEYRDRETSSFMDTFYNKSASNLLVSLIANNKISSQELDQIKKLINESEK